MTDFDRIRVLWPDHLGLARGKYLPTHLAAKGSGHAAAVFSLQYNREFAPAPGSFIDAGFPDLHATMDPDSLRQGWDDEHTGVAVADLTMNHEEYRYSSRHVLRQAIADWADLGFHPKIGIELEGYVMEPDETSPTGWKPWNTPGSFVYGTGPTVDPVGLLDDIMRTASRSGISVESINAEFDNAQFEMTLEYDDALKAADDAFLFRVLARERAMAHGLRMTFMGQPIDDLAGSGVHVNFSFLDADGNNPLADDSSSSNGAENELSTLAHQCLAGLCKHHQAMSALLAPTVNAYRRVVMGGFAGVRASWGYDHRAVGNRVPPPRGAGTRIENRTADGSVSIHLAVAAVLQAARLGVTEELECPGPETGDGFENPVTDVLCGQSLPEALRLLEANETFVKALGPELVANYVFIKDIEWGRFTEANPTWADDDPTRTTEWELNEYMPFH